MKRYIWFLILVLVVAIPSAALAQPTDNDDDWYPEYDNDIVRGRVLEVS